MQALLKELPSPSRSAARGCLSGLFHSLTSSSVRPFTSQVRFRTKDGRLKHLLIDSNVNWNADGSFHHTRCFIRDDTGRQIREAQMAMAKEKEERAHKQKEALLRKVGNVSNCSGEAPAPSGFGRILKCNVFVVSSLFFTFSRLCTMRFFVHAAQRGC